MENFEEILRKDLHQFLLSMKEVDERLPECPDVEDKWEEIALEKVTGECASRVYNALRHQNIEPGTKEAFNAYVSCLHQLYLMGAAMQLNRMGYYMKKNVITEKSEYRMRLIVTEAAVIRDELRVAWLLRLIGLDSKGIGFSSG